MMNDGSPANGKRKTGDSSNSDKDVATKLNKIDHWDCCCCCWAILACAKTLMLSSLALTLFNVAFMFAILLFDSFIRCAAIWLLETIEVEALPSDCCCCWKEDSGDGALTSSSNWSSSVASRLSTSLSVSCLVHTDSSMSSSLVNDGNRTCRIEDASEERLSVVSCSVGLIVPIFRCASATAASLPSSSRFTDEEPPLCTIEFSVISGNL